MPRRSDRETGPEPLRCPMCQRLFRSNFELDTHECEMKREAKSYKGEQGRSPLGWLYCVMAVIGVLLVAPYAVKAGETGSPILEEISSFSHGPGMIGKALAIFVFAVCALAAPFKSGLARTGIAVVFTAAAFGGLIWITGPAGAAFRSILGM